MRLLLVGKYMLLFSTTTGCLARHLPPPTPAQVEPEIADPPTTAPAPGHGRVVLDVPGESANVSRVTETFVTSGVAAPVVKPRFGPYMATPAVRSQELICVTPCMVDLRQGAHTFVFSAKDNPDRESLANVMVTPRTTFVSHAIGKEPRYTMGYVGGWSMIILGSGMTFMGGLTTAVGAAANNREPEVMADGKTKDSSGFLVIGLVMLGVGLALGTTGVIVASNNRPEQQPGATAQWFK